MRASTVKLTALARYRRLFEAPSSGTITLLHVEVLHWSFVVLIWADLVAACSNGLDRACRLDRGRIHCGKQWGPRGY